MRTLDVLSFNKATDGMVLPHLADGGPKDPRVGAAQVLASQDARELNGLVDTLGGKYRFDGMSGDDLGFVTNRVVDEAFPEGCRLSLAGDNTLVVRSPNVHVYRSGVDYAALIYTVDNGILWVTRACGCTDELGMDAWASVMIRMVKRRLQTVKGDEKRTAAIARWQTVSFPLVSGVHWQALNWMRDVKAKTDAGFVCVAGMVQRLELSFVLEGVPQAPATLLASRNHMAFDGDVLVFKTRPSNDDGGDPFQVEWLYCVNQD